MQIKPKILDKNDVVFLRILFSFRVENLSLIGQVLADFEMQRVSVVTHGINTVHIVIIFHLSALSNIHGCIEVVLHIVIVIHFL